MQNRNFGVATNSFILAFVRCFTYISAFVQTIVMSRIFDKFNYGSYSQACLVVSFISPFLLLGLSNAINYFYNQEDKNKIEYVETIYNMVLMLGIIGGLFIILFHNPIASYFSNISLVPLLYIIAFRPLFLNLTSVYQVLYISSNKATIIAIRNTVISITQILMIILVAVFFKKIEFVLMFLVMMDFIQVIIFKHHFSKYILKIRLFKIKRSVIYSILTYAFPLAASTMLGTLSINMDALLIGNLMSTEVFALYSNMAKELPFNFLTSSFTDVVFPKIINLKSKNDLNSLLKVYKAYLEIGIITTWTMVGGAILCAHEIIIILYSSKYIEGISVFIIYLLVSALRYSYHGMILSAYGKSREIMKVTIITLISNFILNIFLFYLFGMIGPALATLVTTLLNVILQMKKGIILLESSLKKIINIKFLARFVMSLIIIGIILNAIKHFFSDIPLLINAMIFFGSYVILVLFLYRKKLKKDILILNRS